MTLYIVHIYREMRLTYDRIEATSHEEAARIASKTPSREACDVDDCEGETFGALVDVVGDERHEHSRMIDFEKQLLRNAAGELLEALDYLLQQTVDMDLKDGIGLSEGEEEARTKALTATAKARR